MRERRAAMRHRLKNWENNKCVRLEFGEKDALTRFHLESFLFNIRSNSPSNVEECSIGKAAVSLHPSMLPFNLFRYLRVRIRTHFGNSPI
jgi:hypothetical protein